jgi:hypothetical protein
MICLEVLRHHEQVFVANVHDATPKTPKNNPYFFPHLSTFGV